VTVAVLQGSVYNIEFKVRRLKAMKIGLLRRSMTTFVRLPDQGGKCFKPIEPGWAGNQSKVIHFIRHGQSEFNALTEGEAPPFMLHINPSA